MNTITFDSKAQIEEQKTDWLPVFEAALRVGKFSSLDELIYRALNAWLAQLAPELRWKIAIELYTNDQISTGRAAQIAGLNYVVFMEKLREHKIPFMAAEPAMDDDKAKEDTLLYAGFNFPSTSNP
jgi:predicted HTH domain antitoxin